MGMPSSSMTRRAVLTAALAGGSLVTMGACDALSTTPDKGGKQSGGGGALEAPSLTEQVTAGKLPALKDRLPEHPLVVQPVDQSGAYGGTWTCAMLGASDTSMLIRTIGYDEVMTWDRDFKTPQPNVAERVDVADEGKTYTLHFRKGMKWSDGKDFTAKDVQFVFDDVYANTELTPAYPTWLKVGGKPPTVKLVDDYTLTVSFAEPHGWFRYYLCTADSLSLTNCPRHYLEKFHAKYAKDATAEAKKAKFDTWPDYFADRANRWTNADLPTVNAWIITNPMGEGTQVVAERNPYYFKTDPGGAQLPYLDEVSFAEISDIEVMLLKASHGEFGMLDRTINTAENKPVLAKNRESGNYSFFAKTSLPNDMVINLNLNHKDATLRKFFGNKNVRIALSHAINRPEIIDSVFQRQGEPWQAAPKRESPVFDEEFATQYTEFDVDKANQMLDAEGYDKKGSDGIRLAPNGKRLAFDIDFALSVSPPWASALQLVAQHWKKAGVSMRPNGMERALATARRDANEYAGYIWWVGGDGSSAIGAMMAPDFYAPITGESDFAILWSHWYTGAAGDSLEPPADVKKQMELYDQLKATVDPAKQEQLLRQFLTMAKEQFYCMGIVSLPDGYGIVRNDFHNVPKSMGESWRGVTPGRSRPEQYFIRA